MVLAEPRCVVALQTQYLADGDRVALDHAVIAGEAGRLVDNHAGRDRVMIAAGQERRPRRRAKRRGMELRVAQPHVGNPVQGRRRDHATEGGWRREADIVGHDQKDVGCAFRRNHEAGPVRRRLHGVGLNVTAENLRRIWQVSAVYGGRRAGARRAFQRCPGLSPEPSPLGRTLPRAKTLGLT